MDEAPFAHEDWVDVQVPNPKPAQRARHTGKMAKTRAQEEILLGILRQPPADWDGSNGKLAQYMGLSVRTVIRLLNGLKAENKIRSQNKVCRGVNGRPFTRRSLQIRSNPS